MPTYKVRVNKAVTDCLAGSVEVTAANESEAREKVMRMIEKDLIDLHYIGEIDSEETEIIEINELKE